MTTLQLILLDHGVALLSVITWFASGVAAALGRVGVALGLLVAAAVVRAVHPTLQGCPAAG